MWDKIHAEREDEFLSNEPNEFAQKLSKKLKKNALLLELGCGKGRDARYFSQKGLTVLATDFSEVAVDKNRSNSQNSSLAFEKLDMRHKFPYVSKRFDVVYSHLALHYYTDEETKGIFNEIHRVLKEGGLFAFVCKTYDKNRMENAQEIEKSVFLDKNNHVLHAFSKEFVELLVSDLFKIESMVEEERIYYGKPSIMLECIARKI